MKKIVAITIWVLFFPCVIALCQCHPPKLQKNPSAEDLMKAWFQIKYTLYAQDVIYPSVKIIMLDKSGFKRTKEAVRKRILLHGERGFDYKDVVSITAPEYSKGLAILTWSYSDIKKQNDIWLWLPSWKKIRKISQSCEDDSFMGTEFTVEDVSTRKFGYEKYKLLGEAKFSGYKSPFDGKEYFKDYPCYKVEAIPKRKNWYYSRRILWLDKQSGAAIFDEFYDKNGKKFKVILRDFAYPEDGCWHATRWEVYNLITGHTDLILMLQSKFNTGLKEKLFTPRGLEREEW